MRTDKLVGFAGIQEITAPLAHKTAPSWRMKGAEKMIKRPRRNHGEVFKAKVALEAIKEEETLK